MFNSHQVAPVLINDLSNALSIRCNINQSNFHSTNIPSRARLSGATAKSVSTKTKQIKHFMTPMAQRELMFMRDRSKRWVFRRFLELQLRGLNRQIVGGYFVPLSLASPGILVLWKFDWLIHWFHREGVQEQNALEPRLVFILGTNKVIPLCHHNEQNGSDLATKNYR